MYISRGKIPIPHSPTAKKLVLNNALEVYRITDGKKQEATNMHIAEHTEQYTVHNLSLKFSYKSKNTPAIMTKIKRKLSVILEKKRPRLGITNRLLFHANKDTLILMINIILHILWQLNGIGLAQQLKWHLKSSSSYMKRYVVLSNSRQN